MEENIDIEFDDLDPEFNVCDENDSFSDSDDEPLIKLVNKKKVPFNQKLKRIPLDIIENTIGEYRKKYSENSNCILCEFKGINIRNLSCHMIHKHK